MRKQLVRIGSPFYEKLPPEEKFDLCAEALAQEEQGQNREYVKESIRQEMYYWRLFCVANDPDWDFGHHFWLPDKKDKLVLYQPVPFQKKTHEYIRLKKSRKSPQYPHGEPVQALGPKSRRQGLTQGISAENYQETRNNPNTKCLVMAHRDDAATDIFQKYVSYWEKDPLAPEKQRSNAKELLFTPEHGGHIRVMTAGVSESGQAHGTGNRLVHISEETRMRHVNPGELISGMVATMPPPNEAWTMIWRETTGFGMRGSFFHDVLHVLDSNAVKHPWLLNSAWWESIDEGGWDIIFASAIDRYDAWMSFGHDSDCTWAKSNTGIMLVATHQEDCGCSTLKKEREEFKKGLTDEEKNLLKNCGATLEWLKWYRYTYKRETKGVVDIGERKRKMLELHPIELMDCFQATGRSTFSMESLSKLQNIARDDERKPRKVDLVPPSGPLYVSETGGFQPDTPLPLPIDNESGGWFTMLEKPDHNMSYCFGVDIAEGTVKGDYHAVYGINRATRKVAFWGLSKEPLHVFCEQVRFTSVLYNNAHILPEVNFSTEFTRWLANCDRKPSASATCTRASVPLVSSPSSPCASTRPGSTPPTPS